jgi:hypothetical protein
MVNVLICYLDDSGGDGEVPAITIGGYVAGLRAWMDFEEAAKPILDRHKIDYLQGKRFHHSKGPFKGWGQVEKRAFVDELYGVFRPLALLGVSFSGIKAELKRVRKETPLNQDLSDYGFTFLALANLLLMDPGIRSWIAVDGIDLSFVVESGHKNDGDLNKVFGILKKSLERRDGAGHKLKSISFVGKKSCTAVQMADFLAYHVTRTVTERENNGRKAVPLSPIMTRMLKDIRHITHTATAIGRTRSA